MGDSNIAAAAEQALFLLVPSATKGGRHLNRCDSCALSAALPKVSEASPPAASC